MPFPRSVTDQARHLWCIAGLIAAAGSLASPAMADVISQDLDFHLNSATPTGVLNFNLFDSSLGTLESVQISFEASRRHAWGIWNNAPDARAVSYDATLTGSLLSLDGNTFGFANAHYGPGTTPVLGSTTAVGFANELLAGRNQFLAGLDPAFPSAYQPGTSSSGLNGTFLSLGFDGSLGLSYLPGTWSVTANNVFIGSFVDVSGTATVTYTFKPVAVPDSALGWLAPAVWVGLAAAAGLRRRANPIG